jgi:hypothetical protein
MRAICWISILTLAACTAPNSGGAPGGGGSSMNNNNGGGSSAGGGDGGTGGGGGGANSDGGTITGGGGAANDGGTVNGGGGAGLLKFAVMGDSRPPNENDTSGYPSAIISRIFSLAQSNGAQFLIGTGDYMFATQASAVTAQVSLFQKAEANYTAGPIYLAMGNHECTGYTDSNCPNLDETPNVQAFMKLLPAGVTTPYYRVDLNTPTGKAKFLFVAANAWNSTQDSWLKTQLAESTAYTFVIRHEPTSDSTAPGVSPSESLIGGGHLTLELNGHTHEYRRVDSRHVISGNGGAPLSSSGNYGLLLVEQQASGDFTVNEIDEASGNITDTWSVSP